MSKKILYFAYGSNMLTERLKKRISSAEPVENASLCQHRLTFSKLSIDDSGKCDVEKTENSNDAVEGVIFEIDERDLDELKKFEKGYSPKPIQVSTSSGTKEVLTFFADVKTANLVPYDWYKDLVVAGAKEHKLSAQYLETLKTIVSNQDHDEVRRAKNEAILKSLAKS